MTIHTSVLGIHRGPLPGRRADLRVTSGIGAGSTRTAPPRGHNKRLQGRRGGRGLCRDAAGPWSGDFVASRPPPRSARRGATLRLPPRGGAHPTANAPPHAEWGRPRRQGPARVLAEPGTKRRGLAARRATGGGGAAPTATCRAGTRAVATRRGGGGGRRCAAAGVLPGPLAVAGQGNVAAADARPPVPPASATPAGRRP